MLHTLEQKPDGAIKCEIVVSMLRERRLKCSPTVCQFWYGSDACSRHALASLIEHETRTTSLNIIEIVHRPMWPDIHCDATLPRCVMVISAPTWRPIRDDNSAVLTEYSHDVILPSVTPGMSANERASSRSISWPTSSSNNYRRSRMLHSTWRLTWECLLPPYSQKNRKCNLKTRIANVIMIASTQHSSRISKIKKAFTPFDDSTTSIN